MFSKSQTTVPIYTIPVQRHTEIQDKENWKHSK